MSTADTSNQKSEKTDRLQSSYDRVTKYIRNAGRDGWWPYLAGHQAATEASAWCSIALRHDEGIASQSLSTFISNQNDDGGWSTGPHIGHSDWTSGPALLALRILAQSESSRDKSGTTDGKKIKTAVQKSMQYMFDSRTEFYGSLARLLLLMSKGATGLEYARGWPWTANCFHWIEPTSYALLALKLPTLPENEVYQPIVTRANQFVAEHECRGGGWNHGSDFCLGVHLPPYIVTTAEALLALQDLPQSSQVQAGLTFLSKTEASECSAMEHAWAILALSCFDKPTEDLVASLVASQGKDGSFGLNLMTSALSAIALETAVHGTNPLNSKST